jgi:hypothetical protein
MKLTQEIDLDKKYTHTNNFSRTNKTNNFNQNYYQSVENNMSKVHSSLPKCDHYSTLDRERRISEKSELNEKFEKSEKNDKYVKLEKKSSISQNNIDEFEDFKKEIQIPLGNNIFSDFESIPKNHLSPNDKDIEIPSHLMNMDMDMIDMALNEMNLSRCEIEKEKVEPKEKLEPKDPTYFNYSVKSFNDSDILDRQNLDLSQIEKKEEKNNQSMFETLGKTKTLRKPPIPALNNLYQKADKQFLNRIQNILKNKETKKLNYASSE